MSPLVCNWDHALFLIFSGNVYAPLIYYSHLGPILVSLLIGGLVFINNPRARANQILFAITILFSVWVYIDLILWASERVPLVMFFWAILTHVELLIYAGALYLVALFANQQKEPSFWFKLAVFGFFIPILFFTHTSLNLYGFDYTNCDRAAVEGPLWQYVYVVELVFIAWATILVLRGYKKIQDPLARKQMLAVSIGAILFMIFFSAGNFVVTYFLSLDWSIEQYKLIGMPIFVGFLAYSMVRYQSFNSKLIAAQALIAALAISVVSLLFLRTLQNVRIIASITTVFVLILGYNLIRSVKREIEQREVVQGLAAALEATNVRQEGLLHFIGHEVKGFLTKDQGAFAAIVEGDLGECAAPIKDFAAAALEQTRQGVASVSELLQASNQKTGKVIYAMAPFDLKTLASDIVAKLQPNAQKKGLALTFTALEGETYMVKGDSSKFGDHVLRNLIDNSINYTPSGSIAVSLKKEGGKVIFAVKDTGVGITDEDKANLFKEGGHGKESQKINVHSTGYGLYIAKGVVEAHGGTIRAESEGPGKGSTFIVELPA
jgi:signal transduction histidine kinase